MKTIVSFTFTLIAGLIVAVSTAGAIDLSSITPAVTPRDSSQFPPIEGAELFVFPGGEFEVEYTAVFSVDSKPGAVVVIPGKVKSYVYDDMANTVTVVFDHVPYVGNVSLPGPETDFSIAFVSAANDDSLATSAIPNSLRGSWMATNISPFNWSIVPPTATNPNFGYTLTGPAGQSAFFKMFIPDTFTEFMAQKLGREVSSDDLAVFNGNDQSTLSITPLDDGSLVNIAVTFTASDSEFESVDEGLGSGRRKIVGALSSEVNRTVTVRRAADISIAANPSGSIRKGKTVSLFGCVSSRISRGSAERIFVDATVLGVTKSARVPLDSSGCYRKSYKPAVATTYRVRLNKNAAVGRLAKVQSAKRTVKVTK